MRSNPDDAIAKLIPGQFKFALSIAQNILKINPGVMLDQVLTKINDLPVNFWWDFEDLLLGVIDGDQEATEKIKKLLGVVVSEN